MTEKIKRNILLNPGPATTTDSVKRALIVPDICPRETDFARIMSEIRKSLLKVVNADSSYTSVLFAGSGTAAVEAVISSVVPDGKKILIINNGAYGERMLEIAKIHKIPVTELKCSPIEIPDIAKIEKILSNDPEITHLALVHHETTTGILNPLREIAELADSMGKTMILDAMSSFAGIPIDFRKIKVDYLISSSNKCIQGMPGISFAICAKNELGKTADIKPKTLYLNLYRQFKYFEKTGQMQFTPPVQVAYALKLAIEEFLDEGIDARYKRYSESWKTLNAGLDELNLRTLVPLKYHSKLLTAIHDPEIKNYDFNEMHDFLYKNGVTIYPGKITNLPSFRIANIGAIDSNDIKYFIDLLKNYFQK